MGKGYSHMPDKCRPPEEAEIRAYIGAVALDRLENLEDFLSARYDLSKTLVFPFGKSYGWVYKYSYKKISLPCVFLRRGLLS